jgi:hypothetical protein
MPQEKTNTMFCFGSVFGFQQSFGGEKTGSLYKHHGLSNCTCSNKSSCAGACRISHVPH